MEALKILKYIKENQDITFISNSSINQAIKEIEALEKRSCKSCKHHLSDNGNFPLSCMECSLFYGNKWEAK
jgi:hypothetical protein